MRRPLFIAEQARFPRGVLGALVAMVMQRETKAPNQRVIAALQIRPKERILDIGCGNGLSLGIIAAIEPACFVAGVDPSSVMFGRAAAQNRELINDRRAMVALADVENLPFEDNSFDKVMCVHTIYFWNDLKSAFGEIARITKSGGKFALLFRTDADPKTSDFSDQVYKFRSRTNVIAALDAAGFSVIPGCDESDEPALIVVSKT